MSRTSNSVTTDYVWDVNRSIPVILQDGTATYVYGRGLISATDSSGDQTYRLLDGLGSTVGLCDGSGTLIGTYAYDAFGIIRAQTGSSDIEFLFTGEQRDDESGYDYLRARYYDSEVGRFLGQDVASPDWQAPVTLNRFAYVGNNPVNMADPTGLEWYDCEYMIYVEGYGEHWVGCEWRDHFETRTTCNGNSCVDVTFQVSFNDGYTYKPVEAASYYIYQPCCPTPTPPCNATPTPAGSSGCAPKTTPLDMPPLVEEEIEFVLEQLAAIGIGVNAAKVCCEASKLGHFNPRLSVAGCAFVGAMVALIPGLEFNPYGAFILCPPTC